MLRRASLPGRSRRAGRKDAFDRGETLGEVIFEFVPVGQVIKVSAIDPVTGTEVSIMGPATENQHVLERVALAKLRFVMQGKGEGCGR